jgi:hypothetical protein
VFCKSTHQQIAIAQTPPPSSSPTTTAMSYMHKLTSLMDSCAEQQGNTDILTTCYNVINKLNAHMSQLFSEEKQDMAKILFGNTP